MKTGDTPSPAKNALEWTVFAGSCLLLAAVAVVLVAELLGWDDIPARLEVTLGAPAAEPGSTHVPVNVTNHGDRVAVNVEVEILRQSGSGDQRAVVSFDHVPRGATCRGHVAFRGADELPGRFSVEVIGHESP